MNEMLSIGKIANGYLIELRVPLKKKESKSDTPVSSSSSSEKQYSVKDAKECAAKIAELLPLLEEEYTTEKEFESAFEDATGSET
jgi:hypothetical protein